MISACTEISQIIQLLDIIISDRTVPKNIRKIIEDSKTELNSNEKSKELKISTAIHLLDDITNDPNMPQYTRILRHIRIICYIIQ